MKISLSLLTLLFLVGCSTSSTRPGQKFDLNNYYAKTYDSCVNFKEKKDSNTKNNIEALCKNEAFLIFKNTEFGFNHDQEKNMYFSCRNKMGIELNNCLLKFKKKAYDMTLAQKWRATDGRFMAMMFLSDNSDAVYEAWNYGPSNKVRVKELPVVHNGTLFEAIVFFSGCVSDKYGNCNVVADWTVENSHGEVLGEIENAPLWVNRIAPFLGQLQISEKGVSLIANIQNKGYLIKAKVKDLIGGRSVNIMQSTTVEIPDK